MSYKALFCSICFICGLCFTALAAHGQHDEVFTHWVGMFPNDFRDENKDLNWNIKLHDSFTSDSNEVGELKISFQPDGGYGSGFTAEIILSGQSAPIPVTPHLYESDWGYGPYFHLTVVAFTAGWVKINPSIDVSAVWGDFGAAFGADNISFIYLRPNTILHWKNDDGETELVVVENTDPDALVVRAEQPIDMWCGNETLRYEPYTTKLIPKTNWIDSNGVSRFNIPHTRGC